MFLDSFWFRDSCKVGILVVFVIVWGFGLCRRYFVEICGLGGLFCMFDVRFIWERGFGILGGFKVCVRKL